MAKIKLIESLRSILFMVQIEKTVLIGSLILPTILLQFNYILGKWRSSQSNKIALHSIPDI